MMGAPLIVAFGFPRPSPVMRMLVTGGLKLRAKILRWHPARRRPHRRTETRQRTHPQGYRIEELGPPDPA